MYVAVNDCCGIAARYVDGEYWLSKPPYVEFEFIVAPVVDCGTPLNNDVFLIGLLKEKLVFMTGLMG